MAKWLYRLSEHSQDLALLETNGQEFDTADKMAIFKDWYHIVYLEWFYSWVTTLDAKIDENSQQYYYGQPFDYILVYRTGMNTCSVYQDANLLTQDELIDALKWCLDESSRLVKAEYMARNSPPAPPVPKTTPSYRKMWR